MAERAGISGTLNHHNYITGKEPSYSRGRMSEKRIELYWKELCNQENSSKSRNRALLDDFERVEQQSAALEAQTKKLKQLKDRYEGYINSMYPRWLDELKRHKKRLQYDKEKPYSQGSKPNNVRFASPPLVHQNQETLMESSLYDTQDVTDYTQNINNQTSIPHGTGRGKTLEWDSFHRDSSLNFYNFGQISSMRTPHGHFAPRNDYMRFSTPYNPLHTGPFDSRNGFNQSFDMMYGPNTSNNNYHPRHPSMGSPIRYNGTAPPANGYGRSYYSEDTHLRQDYADTSYHQPDTSEGYYRQARHQQHVPQEDWHSRDKHLIDRYPQQGDRPHDRQSRDGRPQQGGPQYDRHPQQGDHPHDKHLRDRYPQQGGPSYDRQSLRDDRPQQGGLQYDRQLRDGHPQQGESSQDRQPRDGHPQQIDYPEYAHVDDRQDRHHLRSWDEDTHREQYRLNVSNPHTTEAKSPGSSPSSPYEPPEKPLESATDFISRQDKKVNHKGEDEEISKKKPSTSSKHSSYVETVEKLEQEELSANSGAGLVLSDLQPIVPQHITAKQEMNLQGIDQKTITRSDKNEQQKDKKETDKKLPKKTERIKPDSDDLLDILSDGTLSSGEDSDFSLKDNNAYEPSMDIALDGLTKTSDAIQTKKGSAMLGKPDQENILNKEISKQITTQDNDKKGDIVAVDVLEPSLSSENVSPSVSVKGSLSLLKVVDGDVEDSVSPEAFYRAPRCSQEMKDDIIGRAESGSSLDSYDPSILSMILLDELPKLTRASPSGGLITSDNMESAITEPQRLRNVIEPTLTPLWDGLMPHMVRLVEYNVMAVDEVSGMFAAALLALNSTCTNKFQALLSGLIRDSISTRAIQSPDDEKAVNDGSHKEQEQQNDNHSVTSEESTTLGSTPPLSRKQEILPNDEPPATPHLLERTLSYEDDFEEEVDIPLTETAAYRKMMTGSDQQGKSKPQEEDSEGDDDLERTLARSISPPIVSPRQRSPTPAKPIVLENKKPRRQKPKLNIFSGNDSLGLSYGSEDLGDSWGGSSGRLSSTGKSDVTDKAESPPSSPDLGGGYVPTAMEDNQKKTDTAPKKATRKPDFWNSDTESEVDLQLSTGALDQDEDDDFDFYG